MHGATQMHQEGRHPPRQRRTWRSPSFLEKQGRHQIEHGADGDLDVDIEETGSADRDAHAL